MAEAAIVRRIFEMARDGVGKALIAKTLNAEGALCPRAQQGRANAWSPSSVYEVLFRPLYRGGSSTTERPSGIRGVASDRLPARPATGFGRTRPGSQGRVRRALDRRTCATGQVTRCLPRANEGAALGPAAVRQRWQVPPHRPGGMPGVRRHAHGRDARARPAAQAVLHLQQPPPTRANRLWIPTLGRHGGRRPRGARRSLAPRAAHRRRRCGHRSRARPSAVRSTAPRGGPSPAPGERERDRRRARRLTDAVAAGVGVASIAEALNSREAERQRLCGELAALDALPTLDADDRARIRGELVGLLDDWRGLLDAECRRGPADSAQAAHEADSVRARHARRTAGYRLEVEGTLARSCEALGPAGGVPDRNRRGDAERSLVQAVASPAGFEPASPP